MTDFRATRHYHGPGGLNGRVRNGNGCDPASIVAGSRPGGGQAPSAAEVPVQGHSQLVRVSVAMECSSPRWPRTGRGRRQGDSSSLARIGPPSGRGRGSIGVVKPLGC